MFRGCQCPGAVWNLPEASLSPALCSVDTLPTWGPSIAEKRPQTREGGSRAPSSVHSPGNKPQRWLKEGMISVMCSCSEHYFNLRHSDVRLLRGLLRWNQRLLIAEGSTISVLSCVMRCLGVRIRLKEAESFPRWKPHRLQLPLPHVPAWLCFSISPLPTPRQPTQFS